MPPHDFHDPAWAPRPDPPHGDDLLEARFGGDQAGVVRTCRACGGRIRQARERSRRACNLTVDVDGPHQPADVPTDQPALWWHPSTGWRDRHGFADARHVAAGAFLYRLHLHPVTPHEGAPHPMTAPTFGTPKPPGSNGPSTEELSGKLLLLNVASIDLIEGTAHGDAKAVRCSVVELDTGEEHDDALLFSRTLTNQLVPGTMYLGWLSKDNIGNGKTAWHFNDSSTDPAAVEKATQYLAYKAGQTPAPPGSFTPPPAAAAPAAAPAGGATPPPWAK